jgi:hypothetical protein
MSLPCQLHLSLPPALIAPHTSDSGRVELLCGVQSCHACPRSEAVLLIDSEVDQQQLYGHRSTPSAVGCNPIKHEVTCL